MLFNFEWAGTIRSRGMVASTVGCIVGCILACIVQQIQARASMERGGVIGLATAQTTSSIP